MSPARVRKVAGSEPSTPVQADTDAPVPAPAAPSGATTTTTASTATTSLPVASVASTTPPVAPIPVPPAPNLGAGTMPPRGTPDRSLAVQDRLAAWVCDLSLLHELTERLARTAELDDALHEVLRAGATLVGARRGLIALDPADGFGPGTSVGLGLGRSELGSLETVPLGAGSAERVLRDLMHGPGPTTRYREVAAQLGLAASFAVPLVAESAGPGHAAGPHPAALGHPSGGRLGTAVWFYDEPAEPADRQHRLVTLYLRFAVEHVARCLALGRARAAARALTEELLPARLPRVPGLRMAVRHTTGPRGGGDWYDALPLPEGALGLSVGGVTGAGPGAVAAMGRLRASLRAYAVMEGEDPVAVLSDLELLMRLAEPTRSATALFAYVTALQGGGHKLVMAGAGHCPPLVVGDRRCEYLETSLSAPLNMLSCWEAPCAELVLRPGESVLLYTDGLLHRTGEPADRALARLHSAAQAAPRSVRADPEVLADHVLRTLFPDGRDRAEHVEDLVLLAVRFGD
ncbi:Stage II sporulation protein E (SpoIIE) [Actinacidiphila yanglinensis]|uniref:Stage II sporulation protein E (SpoIIE) n=1 Tax=Actinacidiphila yanglinensis TaxID=310779 RepID=A0A1H6ACW1_9ACTN|nr:PP2C family protein-serine/threonine phosphatase [Actinacidiphila yanglinensis]SEG45586.1 Stage II sporulation protein E (SpoIIE) [Actinacidiphila yanglinensis]